MKLIEVFQTVLFNQWQHWGNGDMAGLIRYDTSKYEIDWNPEKTGFQIKTTTNKLTPEQIEKQLRKVEKSYMRLQERKR